MQYSNRSIIPVIDDKTFGAMRNHQEFQSASVALQYCNENIVDSEQDALESFVTKYPSLAVDLHLLHCIPTLGQQDCLIVQANLALTALALIWRSCEMKLMAVRLFSCGVVLDSWRPCMDGGETLMNNLTRLGF